MHVSTQKALHDGRLAILPTDPRLPLVITRRTIMPPMKVQRERALRRAGLRALLIVNLAWFAGALVLLAAAWSRLP
jgi:hypothetical protein